MATWRERFPRIDQNINRFGYWWAVFGPGGVLSVLMGAVASGFSPIAQYGWGAIVFAGIGTACIIMLVASACLVAWRYFSPLPLVPLAIAHAAPGDEARSPSVVMLEKAAAQNRTVEVQIARLAEEQAALRHRVDSLAQGSESLSGYQRDYLLLLHYAVHQSTVLMLDDVLKHAPKDDYDGPLQLGAEFTIKYQSAEEFVDLVRRKLDPGSWRRSDFEHAMAHAAQVAEQRVEQTPPEQRPSGIDHLALRRWAITHGQCISAIAFVKNERQKAEENLLSQRHELLKLYTEKNA